MKRTVFVFIFFLSGLYFFGQTDSGVDAPAMGEWGVVSASDSDSEQSESAEIEQNEDDAEAAKAAKAAAKEEAARKKAEARAAAKEEKARKKAEAKAAKEAKALKKAQEKALQNAEENTDSSDEASADNENALESDKSEMNVGEASNSIKNEDDDAETSEDKDKGIYYVAEKYYTSQDYYTSVDGTLTEEDILKIRESMRRMSLEELKQKPFPMINWGLTYANVTRVQKQDARSNFVWQNNLFGLFCELQSKNMKPVNSLLRLSIYYPLTHTFNKMSQIQGMFLYAFDLFAGPVIEASMWDYVYLKFGLGIHYMYQLTDEFFFHYLGAGALVGFELPVAPRWTIMLDGNFTYDYPNLGSNRVVQPYEHSWQYHIDFGIRYSKWGENTHSYVRKTAFQTVLWDAIQKQKDAIRADKDRIRAEKKIEYLKAHPEKVARRKKYKAKKLAMADAKAARDAENLRIAEQKVAKMFEKEEKKTLKKEARKAASAVAREKASEARQLEKERRAREKLEKSEKKETKASENTENIENAEDTM